MDFKQILTEKRELIWNEIQKYHGVLDFELEGYEDVVKFHKGLSLDYPKRLGKYVRPSLVLLMCEALGENQEKALPTACAMQTSEDWILIHDDYEDGSLERRGDKALHLKYTPELAINAGDALHVIQWQMLYSNKAVLGYEKTFEVMDEFARMLHRTILGQTVEIKWIQDNKFDLTDEDVFFIMDGKTVYYTIAGPLRLGAIVANANKEQLDAIYEFAIPLGRCFQLRDDLLDLTSDFAGLKKQFCNDIFEGKRTIMLTHLLNNANDSDKKKLKAILVKPRNKKTEAEVRWIRDSMDKHGSINYGMALAEKLAGQARELFESKLSFLPESEAKDALRAGIDFILTRTQ